MFIIASADIFSIGESYVFFGQSLRNGRNNNIKMNNQPLATNQRNSNCISLIKLIAAFQVMYGHIVEHLELGVSELIEKTIWYFNGVPIFFVISGFLIWFSMERSSSYRTYIKKRFWRIYPELWMAVSIEILTIIFFYSDWDIKSLLLFTVTQGTVLQFWTPISLRKYGCGTPNGTLWTICVMIQFYLIAWLIRKILHKRNILMWIGGFILLVGCSVFGEYIFECIGIETLTKLYGQTIVRFCWLFYIGCFIAEFNDRALPILSRYWYAILFLGVVPYVTGVDVVAKYSVFWSMLLVSGLIGFAYRYPRLGIKNDISYGIFLYHMTIVNIFITYGWTGKWWYALAVLAITIICANLSNEIIGKWSVKMKTADR